MYIFWGQDENCPLPSNLCFAHFSMGGIKWVLIQFAYGINRPLHIPFRRTKQWTTNLKENMVVHTSSLALSYGSIESRIQRNFMKSPIPLSYWPLLDLIKKGQTKTIHAIWQPQNLMRFTQITLPRQVTHLLQTLQRRLRLEKGC